MKKRTSFVSNSSSSSYIIDEDSFNNWINKGNVFKLDYIKDTLYNYINKNFYDFYPSLFMDPCDYFYSLATDKDFKIISDDEYVKKFMNTINGESNYYIPESLKEYRDKFFNLWNEIAQYKRELRKNKIDYICDYKYQKLIDKYDELQECFAKQAANLIKSKIKNINIIHFIGRDTFTNCLEGYSSEEEYCDSVFYVMNINSVFTRIDHNH